MSDKKVLGMSLFGIIKNKEPWHRAHEVGMSEEVRIWFDKGVSDLDVARYLFDGSKFSAAAFYCQQSVEKMLKALLIQNKGELVKTHSVRRLAEILKLPEDLKNRIGELEDIERLSRYPLKGVIKKYENYDIKNYLKICEEVMEWIKNKLES
jgi:HEPN domain-containing protein